MKKKICVFPNINEILEQDKKNEEKQEVIENLEEILSNIDRETLFEFEFFTWGGGISFRLSSIRSMQANFYRKQTKN